MILYIVAEVNEDGDLEAIIGQHKGEGSWEGVKRARVYETTGPARAYRTILRKQGREVEAYGVVIPSPASGFVIGPQVWKLS